MRKWLLILVLLSYATVLQARTLHWDEVDVRARLNADGSLDITEIQTFVFNGDWNGGERSFKVLPGQKFIFTGISRMTQGSPVALQKGDLKKTDQFKWVESHVLRWRSRLPGDPPFTNTVITYVLTYRYDNILRKRGDTYILDHNFLFTDRSGDVNHFRLNFEADSAWKIPQPLPLQVTAQDLPPGAGYVLTLEMQNLGGAQVHSLTPLSEPLQKTLLFLGMFLVAAVLFGFYRGEKSKGRFQSIPDYRRVDEKILKEKVFKYLPEEVGALWDENIGPPEVTAVLARLELEGKIKSAVIKNPGAFLGMGQMLSLELLVPHNSFGGYEKDLIKGLFFDGRQKVNTKEIKDYYRGKQKGFDPSAEISGDLNKSIVKYTDLRDTKVPASEYRLGVTLMLLGVVLAAVVGVLMGLSLLPQIWVAGLLTLLGLTAGFFALLFLIEHEIGNAYSTMIKVTGCATLPFVGMHLGILAYGDPVYLWPYLANWVFAIGTAWVFVVMCKTKNPPRKITVRRELTAIRQYFKNELRKKSPNLKDEWLPYLMAFGLAPSIDGWSKSFGRRSSRSVTPTSSGAGSCSTPWSGGGGRFGGAGATGAWVAATGAMAAGVSAPSSSSSGGGGGGGGSSGGGGGGGWRSGNN